MPSPSDWEPLRADLVSPTQIGCCLNKVSKPLAQWRRERMKPSHPESWVSATGRPSPPQEGASVGVCANSPCTVSPPWEG